MIDYQYFAEGGEGAEGAAPSVSEAQGQAPVRDAAGENNKKNFQELISGEYREDFQNRVQEIVQNRLRAMREENEGHKRTLSAVAQKLGLTEIGEEQLLLALEEREKSKSRLFLPDFYRTANTAMQKIAPNFSMEKEMERPLFRAMIEADLPVETAYRVAHQNEILGSAMAYTAEQVRQAALSNYALSHDRPEENGFISSGGVIAKPSVHDLTEKDLIAIEQRVLKGEKIRL